MTAKTSELLLQFNEYATAHDKAFERALTKHPNAKTFVIAATKDPCVFTFVPKHLTRFVEGCTTIGTIDRPTLITTYEHILNEQLNGCLKVPTRLPASRAL